MRLVPGDAVAALPLNEKGEVLLQLRDDKPDIFFPGFWGTFGGAVEPGETPEAALFREMREELGIDFARQPVTYFTELTFDFAPWGHGVKYRKYFIVDMRGIALERLVLGEGRKFGYFDPKQAEKNLKMTPYDAFALWMYNTRITKP